MASRMFVRGVTVLRKGDPAGIYPKNPRYKRIQEMQNQFCRDDGLLVWQKLGRDKGFYYATLAVMVSGFIPSLTTIWKMSFPPTAPSPPPAEEE
ncbi:uncharacterized protein LOC143281204 [Babylonia areolata]|uniref:uncharacterized protein LOC143281204 n=1 Tax=Babylonia areolata TaxID=304850 RepID=UPI003FD38F9C